MPRPWTVVPHDAIVKLEDNLWVVEGDIPGMPMRRRMSMIRLADGRVVLHNGIPLEPAAQSELEGWGEIAFLVVPNRFHRLDIHAYKQRYPALRVLAPEEQRDAVATVVAVAGSLGDLPGDPGLRVERLEGSRFESVLIASSGDRVSLIFGDTVFNNPARLPGLKGALLRLIGSAGGPKVTPLARLATVANRARLRAHLERLADLPALTRLIPSHGTIVDRDPAAALRKAAATAG